MKGNALTHWLKYFLGIEDVITQTSVAEQNLMNKYSAKAQTIVEIGVFEGYNTREFALNSPTNTTIYAIDPFFKGTLGFSYGKMMAKKEWKKNNVSNKIKIVEGFSWDVVNTLPNSIDFIFIDGDHSFEGVKKDFDLYSEKLAQNGAIALHDARLFTNGWTREDWGPVQLVESYIKKLPNWQIVDEVDSLVILQKR